MSATPLKMISSMATREVLAELSAECERALGQPLTGTVAGGVDVAKRVQAGEAVDIVVLNANAIDKLIADGSLLAGSRVDLVKSGVAIAVQSGAPHPDISTEAGVRAAVLAARSVGWSTGPSGVYLEKLLERWGILEQIRPRVVVATPGVPVATMVAKGQCDLGFQQSSEMRNVPGIDVIGPLPQSIQIETTFSGAVSANTRHAMAARAVLQFMASPQNAELKRRLGMQPA